jgi:hypothetical protein
MRLSYLSSIAFSMLATIACASGCVAAPADAADDDDAMSTDSALAVTRGGARCTFTRKDARTLRYSCPSGANGYVRAAAPGLLAVQVTKGAASQIVTVDRTTGKTSTMASIDLRAKCVSPQSACACEQASASCRDDPEGLRLTCPPCPPACDARGNPTPESGCALSPPGGGSFDPCRMLRGGCDDWIFDAITGLGDAFCLGAAIFCS